MSRMDARRRKKGAFFRKNRLMILGAAVGVVVLSLLVCLILSLSNPYRGVLRNAGVDVEKIQLKKGVLTLTFEGDGLGVLSCRSALNALRAEKAPDTVVYRLVRDGEELLAGRVERVGVPLADQSPRVETLNEEMTLLKLKYEFARNGYLAQAECSPTVGLSGKTVTVTVQTAPDALLSAATSIPAALEAVNGQGGGIVRCDVLFTEKDGVFAAASYDLAYGDTLYSSAFYQD